MKINRIIRHRSKDGSNAVNVAVNIDAVVAVNVNEPGRTHTTASARQRIIHRSTATSVVHQKGVHDKAAREGRTHDEGDEAFGL
jgi:hypothetical protein